jgi:hypothetical protein
MRVLVQLKLHPPTFNYDPVYGAVYDYLVLGVPYEQIVKGIETAVKKPKVRGYLLELLPLIRDHFSGISPTYIQTVQRRYYSAGKGLMIPFRPPIIYGVNGVIYFPWFSFWKRNPLGGERLALFVTIVREVLLQDPDLENAIFQILDFSATGPGGTRVLKIIDADEIKQVTDEQKAEMLAIFATGFELAQAALAGNPPKDAKKSPKDPNQDDFDF